MGKVKIKKKETRIDMTAMSDVTVLLLTFFMLTSTFLQKEPVTVITPPSVAEEKVPDANLLSVLVSPQGKVFLEVLGSKDSTMKSETVRADLLKNMVAEYKKTHPSANLAFTNKEIETFSRLNAFGVPITKMKEWLNLEPDQRDKFLESEQNPGVPINMNEDPNNPNEFQMWIRAAYNSVNPELQEAMVKGRGIAIKADQTTPYSVVNVVMDNLQRIDFTPMVDMNMLLITFFMLCTTMIKSQTLQIALPTNEKVEKEQQNKVKQSEAVTIIIDGKLDEKGLSDPNEGMLFYYDGMPETDKLATTGESNMKQIAFGNNTGGAYPAIREILQERNKEVCLKIADLKKEWKEMKFSKNEELNDSIYNEKAKAIRNDSTLKRPVVIIKATPNASYAHVVSVLDEMQINNISRYQIDRINEVDSAMMILLQGKNLNK